VPLLHGFVECETAVFSTTPRTNEFHVFSPLFFSVARYSRFSWGLSGFRYGWLIQRFHISIVMKR
jgi:hypothetical protein